MLYLNFFLIFTASNICILHGNIFVMSHHFPFSLDHDVMFYKQLEKDGNLSKYIFDRRHEKTGLGGF